MKRGGEKHSQEGGGKVFGKVVWGAQTYTGVYISEWKEGRTG